MKLFISHTSRDETEAGLLRDRLAGHGHDVVMPPRSKKQEKSPDDALKHKAEGEIAAADAFILYVSPFLEASNLASHEQSVARDKGKPILVVIGAPTHLHDIPDAKGRFDLTLDRKAGFAALDEALAALAAELAETSKAAAADAAAKKEAKAAASSPAMAPVKSEAGRKAAGSGVTPASEAAAEPDAAKTPRPQPASVEASSPEASKEPQAAKATPAVPKEPEPAPPRPPSSFEHRIQMSVDDARQRMHTKSVPDWLSWAIGSPVTRNAGSAPEPQQGGSAPFTNARRHAIPDWLHRLPSAGLPGGEAMRGRLMQLARSGRLYRQAGLIVAALLLVAGGAWYLFGGDENDRLRQELRNARDRQAEFLTRLSDHLLAEGDRETALLLALEAVDETRGSVEGLAPRSSLYAAWLQNRDDLILRGHGNHVSDVSFSPDPCCVLSASWDETVRLWDIASGRQVLAISGQDSPVNAVAISPDGKRIVTASADGKARLFDAGSAALLHEFTGHADDITGVVFSPDGKQFVTSSADRTAILWEVASKKALTSLKGAKGGLEAVAFSADGRRIATASDDGAARIYEVGAEQPVATLSGHSGPVRGIAFDASGGYVATASEDHTARLWNAYTGKTVRIFDGSQHGLISVAFSGDGKQLVTGGKDNEARIYDVASGTTLQVLKGHKGVVSKAVFSADGKTIATASGDTLVRLWPVMTRPEDLMQAARRTASVCLSLAQRRKYFLAETPPAWCIEMQKPPYQTEAWRTWLKGVKAGRKPPMPEDGNS